jgi:hypothetical protein
LQHEGETFNARLGPAFSTVNTTPPTTPTEANRALDLVAEMAGLPYRKKNTGLGIDAA